MELSSKTWSNIEKANFNQFNEFVAGTVEGTMFRALAEKMRLDLLESDTSEVVFPWGTYTAEMKDRGEGGIVNISWTPSKAFIKMMNDSSDSIERENDVYMDDFDEDYLKLMTAFLAYGVFDPDAPENKEKVAKNRGIKMDEADLVYLINSYTNVLYTIGKDKQRDGKMYRLEIDGFFPHGSFDFDYSNADEIKVKFIPHKVFKQYVKNDFAADVREGANFSELKEPRKEIIPA